MASYSFSKVGVFDTRPVNTHRYNFKRAEAGAEISVTIPRRHKSRRALDESITKVTEALEQVRKEMTLLARDGPMGTDELGDLVEEARGLVKATLFITTRFYHDREEGMRTAQQREYAALAHDNKHGCVFRRFQHAMITVRYDFEARVSRLIASKDSRMTKLQDALHKVEVQKLALVAEGGVAPY